MEAYDPVDFLAELAKVRVEIDHVELSQISYHGELYEPDGESRLPQECKVDT